MAGEPYTPYQICPHHSWLKRRGHQPKKNETREQSTSTLSLLAIVMGMHDLTTYQLVPPPSPA
jgi:hypothetical protein